MPCVAWSQESLRTWNGGLNNVQSPDAFRVWLDALHNLGTLDKCTLQKRLHVQKTNFGNFLLGPCISIIPFCIPDPHYFDMFWDLVSTQAQRTWCNQFKFHVMRREVSHSLNALALHCLKVLNGGMPALLAARFVVPRIAVSVKTGD